MIIEKNEAGDFVNEQGEVINDLVDPETGELIDPETNEGGKAEEDNVAIKNLASEALRKSNKTANEIAQIAAKLDGLLANLGTTQKLQQPASSSKLKAIKEKLNEEGTLGADDIDCLIEEIKADLRTEVNYLNKERDNRYLRDKEADNLLKVVKKDLSDQGYNIDECEEYFDELWPKYSADYRLTVPEAGMVIFKQALGEKMIAERKGKPGKPSPRLNSSVREIETGGKKLSDSERKKLKEEFPTVETDEGLIRLREMTKKK